MKTFDAAKRKAKLALFRPSLGPYQLNRHDRRTADAGKDKYYRKGRMPRRIRERRTGIPVPAPIVRPDIAARAALRGSRRRRWTEQATQNSK